MKTDIDPSNAGCWRGVLVGLACRGSGGFGLAYRGSGGCSSGLSTRSLLFIRCCGSSTFGVDARTRVRPLLISTCWSSLFSCCFCSVGVKSRTRRFPVLLWLSSPFFTVSIKLPNLIMDSILKKESLVNTTLLRLYWRWR
jgi:hypothetical protein